MGDESPIPSLLSFAGEIRMRVGEAIGRGALIERARGAYREGFQFLPSAVHPFLIHTRLLPFSLTVGLAVAGQFPLQSSHWDLR